MWVTLYTVHRGRATAAQFWMTCRTVLDLDSADNDNIDDDDDDNKAPAGQQLSGLYSVRVTVDRGRLLLEYPTGNVAASLAPNSRLPADLQFHGHGHRVDLRQAVVHVLPEPAAAVEEEEERER